MLTTPRVSSPLRFFSCAGVPNAHGVRVSKRNTRYAKRKEAMLAEALAVVVARGAVAVVALVLVAARGAVALVAVAAPSARRGLVVVVALARAPRSRAAAGARAARAGFVGMVVIRGGNPLRHSSVTLGAPKVRTGFQGPRSTRPGPERSACPLRPTPYHLRARVLASPANLARRFRVPRSTSPFLASGRPARPCRRFSTGLPSLRSNKGDPMKNKTDDTKKAEARTLTFDKHRGVWICPLCAEFTPSAETMALHVAICQVANAAHRIADALEKTTTILERVSDPPTTGACLHVKTWDG